MNFCKSLIAFGIALSVLSHSGSKFVIFVAYLINKEFITEILCENKDKPAMECEGKCYLTKELKKEESSKSDPLKSVDHKTEMQWYANYDSNTSKIPAPEIVYLNIFSQENLPVRYTTGIFRPPQA